jgi:hypothetical protein
MQLAVSFFILRRSNNDDAKRGRCVLTTFRTYVSTRELSSLIVVRVLVASCCYMEIFQSTTSTLEGRKHRALTESSALVSCPPPEPGDVSRRLLVCHRAPGLTRGPFRQGRGRHARVGFRAPPDSSRGRRSEPARAPRWVRCRMHAASPEEMGRR